MKYRFSYTYPALVSNSINKSIQPTFRKVIFLQTKLFYPKMDNSAEPKIGTALPELVFSFYIYKISLIFELPSPDQLYNLINYMIVLLQISC